MTRRLLVLTSTYPRWPNDTEPGFVHELCKRLTSSFDIAVLAPVAPGAKAEESMDGVKVHRYRYAPEKLQSLVSGGGVISNLKRHPWKWLLVPFFLIAQLLAIRRLLLKYRPDVVHVHWLIPQGVLPTTLKVMGLAVPPFIVTSHGADLFSLKAYPLQLLKRFVIKHATAATVVSSAMRDEIAKIGMSTDKVRIAPMGVDMQTRFTPDLSVERSRNEILFVGRLVEKKGVVHLISVMPILLASDPSIHLTIAGSGPEESMLRIQVQKLSLQRSVSFLGPVAQSDLPSLYRRAAIFVAPFIEASSGDQEGLGLVTIEAVSCGCPALIGAVPAVQDVPVSAIDVKNYPAFASAILEVLSSPNVAANSAFQQRQLCISRFDWNAVAMKYSELLNETIAINDIDRR